MRKIYPPQLLTAVAALLLGLFSRIECQAQTSTWTGTDPATAASATSGSDENTVFLYNVKTGKFLNRGGWWGVAAVLADNGIEFTVTKSGDNYIFQSKLLAQQSNGGTSQFQEATTCLANIGTSGANQFVVDRSTSENGYSHAFTLTATQDGNGYTMKAGSYLMAAGMASTSEQFVNVDANTAISGYTTQPSDGSDVWKLVTLKERKQAFMKASNETKTNVPGTFLIKDNDFSRRSADIASWTGDKTALAYATNTASEGNASPSNNSLAYYQGNGGSGSYSDAYKWTGNVKGATGDLHQTVSPFRHGWYEIRCRAFSTTTSGTPVLYASVGEATSKTSAKSEYAEAAITKGLSAPTTYIAANDEVNKTATANGTTYYPYEVVVRVYVPEKTSTDGTQTTADESESTDDTVNYETCSDLTFGVKTSNGAEADWLCVDNFELEYLGEGNNNVVLDETQAGETYLNDQAKAINSTIYLNRSLSANAWNTIVLPFDMTQNDIISIFGSGTIVSEFKGAKSGDDYDANTVYFDQTTSIKAGKLYLIKPTVGEPDNGDISVESTEQVTTATLNESNNEVTTNTDKAKLSIKGSYYTIPNIVYGEKDADNKIKTISATVTGDTQKLTQNNQSNYTFAGTYIKKMNVIPVNSFLIKANNESDHTFSTNTWYHVTAPSHALGFRGWLQPSTTATGSSEVNAAKLNIVLNGVEEETTAIDGVIFGRDEQTAAKGIYTISGQRVNASTESLPRGLYIINGKKVVVK